MNKINKKKILILVLVILAIILIVCSSILYRKVPSVRAFFDKYIFRKDISENDLPSISIDNAFAYAFNDNIVCLENNVLTFYNKHASKVGSLDLDISKPIFKCNGKFLCVAEENGSKIYLISNKNILWQKDIEGSISNLSLNKKGYVAVSIADTTYKNICKVYDTNGTDLFTTYLSKTYIIDSAISDDNKFLALAEINSSGIAIQSNIKIISIDEALAGNAATSEFTYSAPIDDFIVNIEYCNNTLVCIYDNHIDTVANNTVSKYVDFSSSNMLFADANNRLVQIEKKSSGLFSSEFELQMINMSSTDKKNTYLLKREPKSMEVFDNVVCVNFGTEVFIINNSGWLIKKYTSSQEIQSVVISNDLAGIVYKNKIEFISL